GTGAASRTPTATAVPTPCASFLTSWGRGPGGGGGQFSGRGPQGVAVDGSGNVFVTDYGNCAGFFCVIDRIQKFTNTGTFLTKWGSPGNGDGQFEGPIFG